MTHSVEYNESMSLNKIVDGRLHDFQIYWLWVDEKH
jgi:hypothetical protein